MSDANTANTPDAAENNTEAASNTEANTSNEEKTISFTQEEVNRLIGKARKEEQQKLDKQIKDAQLSEQQRAEQRVKELEAETRTLRAKDVVAVAAAKLGVKNANAVFKLVKDSLEYDDKGAVTNLKEALAEAKEIAPEFFGKTISTGSADGGSGNNGTREGGISMNDFIRRSAGR